MNGQDKNKLNIFRLKSIYTPLTFLYILSHYNCKLGCILFQLHSIEKDKVVDDCWKSLADTTFVDYLPTFSFTCSTAQPSCRSFPPVSGPCGGSLFGSGTISSPNHPDYYYDNSYCVWHHIMRMESTVGFAFKFLHFYKSFFKKFYDGPYTYSPFLGKVCNTSLSNFYSTSNYMTVVFHSDMSVVGRGFRAEAQLSICLLNIEHYSPSGRVDCSSDYMNIVINRAYLNSLGYDAHNLYVDDPSCKPQISSYEVIFSFPLTSCGTVKHVSISIVFTNNIRGFPSSQGEIVRQSYLKMNVNCTMEPDSVSQITFVGSNGGNSSIAGTGRYNTSMAFYTSSSFYYKVTDVPYEVALNQDLYVQVDMSRHDSNLVLFLDTCVAAPTPFDFETRPYYLVRNGCSVDSTYRPLSSGSSYRARFTFKAFVFLRGTDSVYLQCKVLICPASESNSRCRRGCSRRRARELEPKHESQTLVMGPIQLKSKNMHMLRQVDALFAIMAVLSLGPVLAEKLTVFILKYKSSIIFEQILNCLG
uniref:CUB and zona pellucida-like domains 1, tandem duplicate 2 n=1 Tax=Poecilia latipinna TaxID=48699 RepID=A0A3B3TZ00_9TELE